MKKHLLITIAFSVLFTFQSMARHGDARHGDAQHGDAQRNQIKGPAAKNYKPWKNTAATKTIMAKQPVDIKGPKAKNHKLGKEDYEMSSVVFVEPEDIKGPNAKNQKYTSQPEYLTYALPVRRR